MLLSVVAVKQNSSHQQQRTSGSRPIRPREARAPLPGPGAHEAFRSRADQDRMDWDDSQTTAARVTAGRRFVSRVDAGQWRTSISECGLTGCLAPWPPICARIALFFWRPRLRRETLRCRNLHTHTTPPHTHPSFRQKQAADRPVARLHASGKLVFALPPDARFFPLSRARPPVSRSLGDVQSMKERGPVSRRQPWRGRGRPGVTDTRLGLASARLFGFPGRRERAMRSWASSRPPTAQRRGGLAGGRSRCERTRGSVEQAGAGRGSRRGAREWALCSFGGAGLRTCGDGRRLEAGEGIPAARARKKRQTGPAAGSAAHHDARSTTPRPRCARQARLIGSLGARPAVVPLSITRGTARRPRPSPPWLPRGSGL